MAAKGNANMRIETKNKLKKISEINAEIDEQIQKTAKRCSPIKFMSMRFVGAFDKLNRAGSEPSTR